jgi:putative ABC transport system substrate-binding protein
MRRREFIAGLGSAAVWPLAARAQQGQKMLRVGTVSAQPRSFFAAFEKRMAALGYEQGKNFALEVVPAASPEGFERGFNEAGRASHRYRSGRRRLGGLRWEAPPAPAP